MRSDPGDFPPVPAPGAAPASPAPTSGPDSSAFLIGFTKVAGGFLALGVLVILLYALQDIHLFFSVFATALLLAFAALALGLLAGFIFGIPSTPKHDPPATPPAAAGDAAGGVPSSQAGRDAQNLPDFQPYRPNTNLEKISDWLATILVGIGLTQILKLPGALEAFGNKLKPALGNTPAAGWVAIGILLLYIIAGFLLSFLWTRVKIPELYALSDVRQKMLLALAQGKRAGRVEGLSEGIPQGERRAIEAMAPNLPLAAEALVPKGLAPEARSEPPAIKHILWVDEHPENSQGLRALMAQKLGADFDLCASTAEALSKISSRCDLVISDSAHGGDPQAGASLLQALRQQGYNTPYLVYTSRVDPGQGQTIQQLGGNDATASPVQLMVLAEKALKG